MLPYKRLIAALVVFNPPRGGVPPLAGGVKLFAVEPCMVIKTDNPVLIKKRRKHARKNPL